MGAAFSHESAYGAGNFSAFKSAAKSFSPSAASVKEVWPRTSLPGTQHFVLVLGSLAAEGTVSLNERIKRR